MRTDGSDSKRCGVTLVELLVVVTILVILVAVVLPLAQPVLKQRGAREASRMLNGFVAAAQARAMSSEFPVGIMFQRDANDPSRCFEISLVKTPPSFAGQDSSSTVSLDGPTLFGAGVSRLSFWRLNPSTGSVEADPVSRDNLVRLIPANESFEIRLGYNGPYYSGIRRAKRFLVAIPNPPLQAQSSPGMPYRIRRLPKRSAGGKLELPTGSYIDMDLSGLGPAETLAPNDIILMFDNDGSVKQLFAQTQVGPLQLGTLAMMAPTRPLAPLFLLVANTKETSPGQNLLAESGSIWVGVDHRTGRAWTSENVGGTTGDIGADLAVARTAAQAGPMMGGR